MEQLKKVFEHFIVMDKKKEVTEKQKRRCWTIFAVSLIVITAIIFFITDMNEVVGIIFLLLSAWTYYLNNEEWGNRFRESFGIAILAGLIVLFSRDLSEGILTDSLTRMYFLGLAAALLLIGKSASEGEDI